MARTLQQTWQVALCSSGLTVEREPDGISTTEEIKKKAPVSVASQECNAVVLVVADVNTVPSNPAVPAETVLWGIRGS
jgi:hypothetical protein